MKMLSAVLCLTLMAGSVLGAEDTKEHYQEVTTVRDGPLDAIALITTGDRDGWSLMRAGINKQSGTTLFQLYQTIIYNGNDWRFYGRVTVETAAGPTDLEVRVLDRKVDTCGDGCRHEETLGVNLDEKLVREIAARYVPGQSATWSFKFSPHDGPEKTYAMSAAQVAGFLARVDAYVASRRSPLVGSH